MNALADSHKLSIAGLLLCLVAGLGHFSPDAVHRTRSSSRTKAGIVRLDDHEASGEGLAHRLERQSGSDSGLSLSVLPVLAVVVHRPLPSARVELTAGRIPAVSVALNIPHGRGPPILS
jgi:hypothetical protein